MDLSIGIVALIVITLASSDVVEYGVLKSSNTPEFPRCVKPNISAPVPSIIEKAIRFFPSSTLRQLGYCNIKETPSRAT